MAGRPVQHMEVIVFGDFSGFADVLADLLRGEFETCTLLRRFP